MNSASCSATSCQLRPVRAHHRRNNAIEFAKLFVVDSAPSRPNRTCRKKPSATATTTRSSSSTVQYLAPDGNLTGNARILRSSRSHGGPVNNYQPRAPHPGRPAVKPQQHDVHATSCNTQLTPGEGLRLGELLDLELDCVVDFASHGSWLKVPLGKLGTERTVPLDEATLVALDGWTAQRDTQRALPHPRHGKPTDFLFVERGRQLSAYRLRQGLADAASVAGLRGPDGTVLHVTPHQLRHTYGTTLVNGGMSLQALMALLGHVSAEMTLRYASLASPTVRAAYDQAMSKARSRLTLPIAPVGQTIVPDRVQWLRAEMLKTRVAHGYCSRSLVAEACSYANICEQCDNFTTSVEFIPALRTQLVDATALRDDAETRGWDTEVARHARLISSLTRHLDRPAHSDPPSTVTWHHSRGPVNRDLLRHHHPAGHPPGHLHQRRGPRLRHRQFHRRLERPVPAVHVDQVR